jgi:Ser/Thr protein kinase RdoA (MazF antagonist)
MTGLVAVLRRHWNFESASLTPLGGGMNSHTWLVEHGGIRYVAKQVPQLDLPELLAGCEAADRLAEAGVTTGRPLPTVAGSLVVDEPATALLEHVAGRELDGSADDEQRWMADTLAGVHHAGGVSSGPATEHFFEWLAPEAPGLQRPTWLAPAVAAVRAEVDGLELTWSLLHTDPAPEAFVHDDSTGVTGLIDWTGACRGPVLYDVASAVMYLGGPFRGEVFLRAYREHGVLREDEWRFLAAFRRFRWAVQAAYFARRLAETDLTGVLTQADNQRGLDHARRGLAELGVLTS